MFEIDFDRLVRLFTPNRYKRPKVMAWLWVAIYPIRCLYLEFVSVRQELIFRTQFTGQIIYLEHYLNYVFNGGQSGIYISNVADTTRFYLYRSLDQRPPRYVYRKWRSTVNYNAGEFGSYNGTVYKAVTPNTGQQPDMSTAWQIHKPALFIGLKAEYYGQFDFIVFVPAALVFDAARMRSEVDYYRFAGRNYTIQSY